MNISVIGFYQYPVPPLRGGSLAKTAYELTLRFAKNGHYVNVISVKDPGLPDYEKHDKTRYFRVSKLVSIENNIFKQGFSDFIYSFYAAIKMGQIPSVDVIQCFGPLMIPFLRWFKIHKRKPIIIRFGMGFGLSQGWNFIKRPNWFFLRFAERVIVPSHFLKRSLIANLKVKEEQISVIPNGVNLNRFNPSFRADDVRCKYNLANSPVILFVGRVSPEKGIDLLLESLPLVQKRIRDVKLLVVGPISDVVYRERLRSLISELGLSNVIFTGAVDILEELPKIYATCNVFCCPSRVGEAFGNVVVEAMASGKPVVATKSGGIPEVVQDGKVGYIVPTMQKKELAEALIAILENENLQRRMGRNARKRAEELFSWDRAAKEYLKVYNEVINAY